MEISAILNKTYQLPEDSKQRLIDIITEVEHPKGYHLIRANRVERSIYFVKKGIIRAYTNSFGDEITFWFGKEGDLAISMKSYVNNQSGYEDIELLEDCTLYQLNIDDLHKLFAHDIHLANWGRKLIEQELLKTEERLITKLLKTATDRYAELLENTPELLQRIQLSYIASYLGITQVSLSRIRSKLR